MTAALLLAGLSLGAPPEGPDYLRDIKPLLHKKCSACHGAVRQKAGLRLDAAPLIRKGTKRGPVIEPGKPNESLLIEVIADDPARMPPRADGEHLSPREVELFRDWIRLGAKMPDEPIPPGPKDHWAYQPPTRPPVPQVPGADHPIDAFLDVERRKHNFPTAPEADRATLLRRVTLDLIGIPPTPAELHAFLTDPSADAYEKVVDRLLRSPLYGERWGRHWMDVWRYSDPFGLGEEYRYSQRHVWRWRDWIIESLNADKGYDRMVLEMLAGDELAPADPDTLRATGYLARNWYKFNRNVWLQDTVEYTAAGFLGITMRCARCHDHKYDPVSQEDYYRFRAFFEPHDVRIDPVPGQPDLKKDGVARAFDARPAEPTYRFARGDERMPDKSKALSPGVPGVLGADPPVTAIAFRPQDFAAALPTAAAAARRIARTELDKAEGTVRQTEPAVAAAKRQLEAVVQGKTPKVPENKAFLHDTFAKKDGPWKVLSGTWAWENGRLVCKAPSTFATVTATRHHPAALLGRIRYTTTGGGVGSVGFSYDVTGTDFQAVYVNAGKTSAVRPFHRVNGQDSYPSTGVVPYPVKFGDEVTLDFAVRGDRLNVWVNGKLTSVYRLPVARQPGTFTIWAHDATAEFREVRLCELPASVVLAERPGESRASPLGGPSVLTKADAEQAVRQAEAAGALASARLAAGRVNRDAVEARIAADTIKLGGAPDATWRPLALAAGKAERKAKALQATAALLALEQAPTPDQAKVAAARKVKETADVAAAKDDPAYTPLIQMDPATSTGRRLALAKWIADAKNPLTARVAVNHIWKRHFGAPLVPTVANFGLNGKPPTHPALLDWLAVEFAEAGWSMKQLHRLMVTARAYRLSSRVPDGKPVDPENRYYGRMNPRRMEAEVVRDSVLAVAGRLDPMMGGPILDETQGQTSRRRSVYFRFNTEYKMPFLDQFDAASPTECFERRESVIPQQALALHNSGLAINMSRDLAQQIAVRATDPAGFVTAAFEHVLNRAPTDDERARCETFLREQAGLYQQPAKLTPFPPGSAGVTPPATDPTQRAREDLVQVLFNHNDFVTIR